MPYNPGIAPRGELMGMGLGAGLQSMAQQYGEGLKLQEEQKRYNKQQKQQKKDRLDLEKADLSQAKILARASMGEEAAKEFISNNLEVWDAAEVRGWMTGQTESMKFKAQQMSYDLGALKLEEYENILKQKPIMRQAMADMAMGTSEQNLSAMDSLNLAVSMNPDLSPDNVLKLNDLVQKRQSIKMEGRVLELRELANQIAAENARNNAETARIQGEQVDLAQQKFKQSETIREEGPKATDVEGLPNYKAVTLPDGRTSLVSTKAVVDPVLEMEKKTMSDTVDKKVKIAYEEADQIARGGGEELKELKGGDERTGLGVSRYDRLAGQLTELEAASSQYKAKTGKEHPGLKSFYDRVGSLVMHMREQDRTDKDIKQILQSIGWLRRYNQMKSEGRDKEAKQFADEFGVDLKD